MSMSEWSNAGACLPRLDGDDGRLIVGAARGMYAYGLFLSRCATSWPAMLGPPLPWREVCVYGCVAVCSGSVPCAAPLREACMPMASFARAAPPPLLLLLRSRLCEGVVC